MYVLEKSQHKVPEEALKVCLCVIVYVLMFKQGNVGLVSVISSLMCLEENYFKLFFVEEHGSMENMCHSIFEI